METQLPKPSEFIKRTLVGRSVFALESVLHSKDKEFFLSVEHVEALTKLREKLHVRSLILYIATLVVSISILASPEQFQIDIKTPFGSIEEFEMSKPLLLFGLSLLLSQYVITSLNAEIIRCQRIAIFQRFGLDHADATSRALMFGTRWQSKDIWADMFTIRAVGFKSGALHLVFSLTVILVMLAVMISQVSLIFLASFDALTTAYAGNRIVFWLVAAPSFATICLSLLGGFIAVTVPLKFPWKDLLETEGTLSNQTEQSETAADQ